MKKILQITAIITGVFSYSQQWNGSTNTNGNIDRNGSISIGTTDDLDRLNVGGNIRLTDDYGIIFGSNTIINHENIGNFTIKNMIEGLYILPSTTDNIVILDPFSPPVIPDSWKAFVLKNNSKIGMGTDNVNCSSCEEYRLFVKDGIKTEKVKVEIADENDWADYVFNKDYKLMSLKNVEDYIKDNGHLPEVPSTEDAIKNGIELKNMNILLLKKIEELTLHLIEQNKRIEELESKTKN